VRNGLPLLTHFVATVTAVRDRVPVIAGEFEDLVGTGLKQLIAEEPSIELVASEVPVARIPTALDGHPSGVVVLNLSAIAGPRAVHDLHDEHPEASIVVLADRPTSAQAAQLISFGAAACLPKETQGRDVINAIHLASRGINMMPRSSAAASANDLGLIGPDRLTAREADVLELLRAGHGNAQIADVLSIGVETVRTHARNIYRKLGVSSRRDLAGAPSTPVAGRR
jgi:DNA-binding NarL/FixJ family response regulator